MIRFSCKKCGKSLRADEKIVGRSTRCTACQKVNRVPEESTRQSGQKLGLAAVETQPVARDINEMAFDEEIVTLIADSDSDSDSFDAFENLDFSKLRFDPKPATSSSSSIQINSAIGPSVSPSTAAAPQQKSTPAISVNRPAPSFGWQRSSSALPWRPILIAIGIGLLLLTGYLGWGAMFRGAPIVVKSELEKSSAGLAYQKSVFEFKRASQAMSYMLIGFREKKLPESELTVVNELKEQTKMLLDDSEPLAKAIELYNSGDRKGAQAILNERSQAMQKLKTKIEQQTGWLKRRVYGG